MRDRQNPKRLMTTLGELVEAVSEAAFEYCQSTKEAYAMASLVLADILGRRFAPARVVASPRRRVHRRYPQ